LLQHVLPSPGWVSTTYTCEDIYTRAGTTPRWRIKGEDIRVLEGRKGLSYAEEVTLCQSSQERGILQREKIGEVEEGMIGGNGGL